MAAMQQRPTNAGATMEGVRAWSNPAIAPDPHKPREIVFISAAVAQRPCANGLGLNAMPAHLLTPRRQQQQTAPWHAAAKDVLCAVCVEVRDVEAWVRC